MATIRRSGSGWQALIRRKNHVGPRSKTFPSEYLARCWAKAVEESAADKKTGKIHITAKELSSIQIAEKVGPGFEI